MIMKFVHRLSSEERVNEDVRKTIKTLPMKNRSSFLSPPERRPLEACLPVLFNDTILVSKTGWDEMIRDACAMAHGSASVRQRLFGVARCAYKEAPSN